MSRRYTLRDDGYPFKRIYTNRKAVGRVARHAEGGFVGIIGAISVRAATEAQAFDEVCARVLGYDDANALHQRNAKVRASNNERRAQLMRNFDRFARGDLPFLDLFNPEDGETK